MSMLVFYFARYIPLFLLEFSLSVSFPLFKIAYSKYAWVKNVWEESSERGNKRSYCSRCLGWELDRVEGFPMELQEKLVMRNVENKLT